ncbi:hypothetical protein [uncultured Bacteroides sp.]|uniref:hypothetical protein n=1 Tax=uncultured Bacteroides sp. TaxID=162156 RepID=UPI0025E369F6|nr:hypothetical protein [uncultured Bacteroides sp.]
MRLEKIAKFVIGLYMLLGIVACGTKSKVDNVEEQAQIKSDSEVSEYITHKQENIDLINKVYNKFVFAIDSGENDMPEDYFTANALRKLQNNYEFDCEDGPCYAYYALRTKEQDSKPGSENKSQIISVEPMEADWWIVSYLDMGWRGMTRIKIIDRKIDDYERCISDL